MAPPTAPSTPPAPKRTPSRRATPPSRTSSRSQATKSLPPLPLSQDPATLLKTIKDARGSDGTFDPIAFLNKHYGTELSLSQQLPSLREAVNARMAILNTSISDAMQRQSETAETTRKAVRDAKSSVMELERRILQVKEKANHSESAVLEITKDMKRLDCAKQHLQRTITALKQLHMLVHAVEQLRLNSIEQKDYKNASHLVQAIAQLLQHFEAYENKVEQMKLLSAKVKDYKEALRKSLVTSYRVTAFGYPTAMILDGKKPKSEDDQDDSEEQGNNEKETTPDIELLKGGILYIDALGENHRERFIHDFCQDLLGDYLKKFEPADRKPERRVSSFKAAQMEPENVQAGLDHIDKRLAWFHEVPLKIIKDRFPDVFPSHWNLQASLANMFLQLVGG